MTAPAFVGRSAAEQWAELSPEERSVVLSALTPVDAQRLLYDWKFWARPDQVLPPEDFFAWLLLSGRGAGKTRTGAETVKEWAGGPKDPPVRIALVAETVPDAREVMVEGESGILSISPPWNMPKYQPSRRKLTWPNGSVATTFSGDEPDQLRGPQFHKAWVDELAKFQYPQDVWDNLELSLRLGEKPQVVVTTTPRPIQIIKDLLSDPLTIATRVSTYANLAFLAPSFIRRVVQKYEGTRLGRQELYAEVLSDTPGALWTYETIERNRIGPMDAPAMDRIVISIDPPISSEDDANECGLIVGGSHGRDIQKKGYVIFDGSGIMSPDQWAKKAIMLYDEFGADRIVAEKNQGGEMVKDVLLSRRSNLPVKLVHASRAKVARAEPVAAMYEQNRIKHIGSFARLEDQMTVTTTEGYQGPGSPDRMDALVWLMYELMVGATTSLDPADYANYRA